MKRKWPQILITALTLCVLVPCQWVHANKSIKIDYVSGLNFGTSVSGDPPKSIPPGTTETATNASFSVRGQKNRTYQVIVPSSVFMNHSVLGAAAQIRIDNFSFFPASPQLDNRGDGTLYVGATRAALPLTQTPGTYSGTFVMTVVY